MKKKIKAAELSGKQDGKNITAEEEEAEEAAQIGGAQVENASEPQFYFIARITDEQRRKAFAEAFSQAKRNGEELAAAAGIELGPLVGLSGHCNGAKNLGDDSFGVYDSGAYQRLKHMQQLDSGAEQQQNESIATDPGSLEFTISVSALFKTVKRP
jgi:hypothetical protein